MTLKTAIDDAGAAAGELTMTLPAGGARTVSAAELESTENRSDAVRAALQGELGVGVGKWQLLLAAETPVVAMSLLKSPGGHLSNLSTAPYRSVAGGNAIRQMAEDIEAGTAIGAPVTADLGGEGELVHLLDGADAASFTVDSGTGQLRTAAGVNYNFEAKDRYAVAVVAEDGEGGDASIAVTVKVTDEDGEAPHTPAEPLLTGATTTSLTIAWTPPTNNGPPITNYTVEYRVLNTGNFAEWPHTGTTTSATIENLDKSTIYQAVVQATNDEGTSLRSTRLLATTRAPHSTEPVHARDSSHEEQQGGASGIPVTLIDSGFAPPLMAAGSRQPS